MSHLSAIDETKSVLLSLEQQLRMAREGAMPLTQERVAALAFHLGSLLDHMADVAPLLPENDQVAGGGAEFDEHATLHSLVQLREEISGGRDRRLIVASFATRWFVLAGFRTAPLHTYGVHGPFEHHTGAVRHALQMHRDALVQSQATPLRVER